MLVGSNTAWCHPVLFQRMPKNRARTRRQDRGDRSAPHRDRRGGRSVSADRAGHRHRAVLRAAGASGGRSARSTGLHRRAHDRLRRGARARARDRAGRRRDRRAPTGLDDGRRGALLSSCSAPTQRVVTCYLAGREPVGAGHRQGQRHHQLPSRHRPHRQARHGAVLADRPAQRDGRTRGRRARQPAGRAHGLLARRGRSRAPLLECAAAWPSAKASRPCRCSRRSSAARSRRCG